MRILNATGLPEQVYRAAVGEYDKGDCDLSISEVINSPRIVALTRLHNSQLVEDVADMGQRLIGNALHDYLEKFAEHPLAEKRQYANIGGWTISGKPDGYAEPGHLYDFKTVSITEWQYGVKEERELQLNCYAALLRANGHPVERLTAVLVFKDYKRSQRKFHTWYPPRDIMEVDIPLWPHEQAVEYIRERVELHQSALHEAPLCSDEERWYRPGKWAVVKTGNKRATKLHDTEEEAYEHIVELGGGYHVEAREGTHSRCEDFCLLAAQNLCQQWIDIQNGEGS